MGREEGWNPGLADADAFWAADPDGFLGVEREGELIGSGSIVSYGGEFGFMGLFIVRPDLRGRGIGRRLWRHRRDLLRDRLRPGAAIGLDGVFDMQAFYAAGGFELSHRGLRLRGTGDEGLRAMGVIRPCREGHKVGPLFAESPDLAERMLTGLVGVAAGEPVSIDVPEANAAAIALAERHGMTEVFGCARMYMGPAPELPWERVYGITSFELG